MPLPGIDPDNVRRAAGYATDAIKLLQKERCSAKEIAAGFALALQRLPVGAWLTANPGQAAAVSIGVKFLADVVKAVRDGTPPKIVG